MRLKRLAYVITCVVGLNMMMACATSKPRKKAEEIKPQELLELAEGIDKKATAIEAGTDRIKATVQGLDKQADELVTEEEARQIIREELQKALRGRKR